METDRSFEVGYRHRLVEVMGALDAGEGALAGLLDAGGLRRAGVFIDGGLAAARATICDEVVAYAKAHAIEIGEGPVVVPGGEAVKNEWAHVERMLGVIEGAGLCRQSYVIAIGGGAVLDAAGLAASLAHRGVRLIRLPTTTVGQGDSGVGVKNGINMFGKKNYLGVFAPPWGVINDPTLLTTLSERDWRCGFSEAVKVALVKDGAFFDEVERGARAIAGRDLEAARPVLWRSALMHLDHIALGGDPFELTTARPLDFGHWSAHKLEQMSGFEVRHGEAVAIGIAIDTVYSRLSGWLDEGDATRVVACLHALGFALDHALLTHEDELLSGIEEFREHLGGRLTVSMLRGIGEGFDVHEIDEARMREAIGEVRALRAPAGSASQEDAA